MPAKYDDSEVLDTDDIDMNDIVPVAKAPPPPPNPRHQGAVVDVEAGAFGSSDDPFAKREGKTLTWKNINMTLVRVSICLSVLALMGQSLSTICLLTELTFPAIVGGTRRQTRAQALVGCVG
jgi:hypothetical protein